MATTWGDFGASIGSSLFDFGMGQASSAIQWSRQKKLAKRGVRWRMADMRAAGVNPLLAVAGGMAPSSGSVPMGQTGRTDIAGATAKMSSARAIQKTLDQLPEEMEQRIRLLNAQNVAATSAGARDWQAAQVNRARERQIKMATKLMATEIPSAKAMEKYYQSWLGERGRMIRQFRQDVLGRGVSKSETGGALGKALLYRGMYGK